MAAVGNLGGVLISSDSGNTWILRTPPEYPSAVALSNDGSRLAVTTFYGPIFISTDAGVTWTPRASEQDWRAIASSADGQKLVAAVENGDIYTSADAGVTWVGRGIVRNWSDVASSADGNTLIAAASNGGLFISHDVGESWQGFLTEMGWQAVASSSDGLRLAATGLHGGIFLSSDGGITWNPHATPEPWWSVAVSANGRRLVGAGQQIYTGSITPVASGSAGSTVTLRYAGDGQWREMATTAIADGAIGSSQLADGAVTAEKIGGVLEAGQIPSLTTAHIPSLDASHLASGVLDAARIPFLDAAKNCRRRHRRRAPLRQRRPAQRQCRLHRDRQRRLVFRKWSGIEQSLRDQISSGTVSDARLSANVPLLSGGLLPNGFLASNIARLDSAQTVTGALTFNPPSGPPFAVGSATKVVNLNADLLDGLDSTAFAPASGSPNYAPASGSDNYLQNQIAADQAAGFRISGDGLFNGGRVGIGFGSAPEAMLEIAGGGGHDGTGGANQIALTWQGGGFRHWIRSRHAVGAQFGNAIDFFTNTGTSPTDSTGPGTGSVLSMTVNNQRVGIGGVVNPVTALDVQSSSNTSNGGLRIRKFDSETGKSWNMHLINDDALILRFRENDAESGNFFWFNAQSGASGASSDARLKEEIETMPPLLDRVTELRPVTFRAKDAALEAPRGYGFIAQEVEGIFPDLVEEMDGYKTVAYSAFVPVAIAAIQEQQEQIAQQAAQIARLEELLLELLTERERK